MEQKDKKKYEAPTMQVVKLRIEGIICASKQKYTPTSW